VTETASAAGSVVSPEVLVSGPPDPSAGTALEHGLDVTVDALRQDGDGTRAVRAADADHLATSALDGDPLRSRFVAVHAPQPAANPVR
jgi:hypothetical protein